MQPVSSITSTPTPIADMEGMLANGSNQNEKMLLAICE
jgi:hypothetical protein